MNKLEILRKVSYSAKQIFLIRFSVPNTSPLTSPQGFASSTKSLLKTDWVQQAEALNSIPSLAIMILAQYNWSTLLHGQVRRGL